MRDFSNLRPQQRDAIDHILSGEDSLIWATVGAGKTVIAQSAIEWALGQRDAGDLTRPARWLIVAPKRVALEVWPHEHGEWSHLEIQPVTLTGFKPAGRRELIEDERNEICVINYELLPWLLETYPRRGRVDKLPFDGIVFDEVDKLKDASTNRFKALRHRIQHFKMRVGMTGTPRPNRDEELWAQTFVVDNGETFGRSFYKWRKQYFYPTDFQGYRWAPFSDTHENLLDSIADLVFQIDSYEGLPPIVEVPPRYTALDAGTMAAYKELERELFVLLYDEKGETRAVNADSAGVLVGKLQQMCAGFSYVPPAKCVHCGCERLVPSETASGLWMCTDEFDCGKANRADILWHSHQRFNELDSLISELQGEQLMIAYHFRAELEELKDRYPDIGVLGAGVTDKQAAETIRDWNAGKLELLAMHPASAGHGLNLQHSGARHIAFLTIPWSGGLYAQVIGRLARSGQDAPSVFVHRILNRGTIDEDVAAEASHRLAGNTGVLNAMRQRYHYV